MQKTSFQKYLTFAGLGIAFFILLLVVFRGFVFDSSTLMLNSDQLNGIGSKVLRSQNLVLTEWDDSRLGGVPTIDALFGDAYHPLVLVEFLTDPARAVGFKFILIIWVAFLSATLLAKEMTGSLAWGSFLGFLYAFSPQYFSYVYGGHDGKMMVFAIAPLAILSIQKIIREGSLKYFAIFALSVVWMILGSHLQLTYLFLWGAGFYALFEMLALSTSWKMRTKRLGIAAGALAIALGMSLFQILPPYLYTTAESVRGSGEKTNYGHSSSWSLHQEELASMIIPGFLGVDVYEQKDGANGPELDGSALVDVSIADYQKAGLQGSPFYWGHNSFKLNHDSAGIVLTFLAFLCFFIKDKRRWAAFWFVGGAVALSYAMGAHSPLFKLWFTIIPGMKSFRAPSMAMFWLPLLMLMMAAPVLKEFGDPQNKKNLKAGLIMFLALLVLVLISRFVWTSLLGIPGLLLATAYGLVLIAVLNVLDRNVPFSAAQIAKSISSGLQGSSKLELSMILIPFLLIGVFMLSGENVVTNPETAPYFKGLNTAVMSFSANLIWPSFILAAIATIAVWFVLCTKLPTVKKAAILAIAAGIELYTIDGAFVQNVPENEYVQVSNPVIAAIHAEHPDELNRPRVFSIAQDKALSGNSFPLYDLRNTEGFHDNELASYRAFRGGQSDENYMYNINQVAQGTATNAFLDLMNVGDIIYDTRAGTMYFPNRTAVGEAKLYGDVAVMNDAQTIAELRSGFDYQNKIILSEKPESATTGIPQGYAKVIDRPKMDNITYEVNSDRPAFMFSSGNYHRYWKATVNGKPAKVYKAFGTLRAVQVPEGKSIVKLEYRSDAVRNSLYVGLAALVIFITIIITGAIFKQKKSGINQVSQDHPT